MEYNFLEREVYMPEKYFRKDRHVKLSKTENIFFATLWFSKDNRASSRELYNRVYGYKDINLGLLRKIGQRLRKKGIKVLSVYKYGYRLKEK